ncbi:unnamed protein product [Linum tenue]|uniref:Uncharacterized protein n=1 Tax=Linum tenue TaxID=586396 RepID=A0AAV0JDE3_9ROSI|nr:unnamed protein product [Linum tenue]
MLTKSSHMATSVSGIHGSYTGFLGLRVAGVSRLPYGNKTLNRTVVEIKSCRLGRGVISGGAIHKYLVRDFRDKHISSAAGRDGYYQLSSYEDELPKEDPFWISLMKEGIWGLKSLFAFLVEQPSQLKHLEWPGFQSTLKTATLTLVLVALLIVALSSIDSILCYLLALFLRRTP